MTITPAGGTVSTASQSITIDWCGHTALSPASRQILLNGVDVTASFSYGTSAQAGCSSHASSTGTITLPAGTSTLTASIEDNIGQGGSDGVWFTLSMPAEGAIVSLTPHNGTNRNVALCVANCFDEVVTYATPSYRSMDTDRSLTLLYRSAQAAPVGTVTLDVRDTAAGKTASQISVTLLDGNNVSVAPEKIFVNQPGQILRIATQFDASGLTTGAYVYTAAVKSYYTDLTSRTTSRTVRVLIVNERSSPYGAGWSVAGLQRAYPEASGPTPGVTVIDGTGSAQYFAGPCAAAPCSYVSPAADFTTMSRSSAGGWNRRYPDGTVVNFDAAGYEVNSQDRFGNTTSYLYIGGRLSSVTDPVGQVITVSPTTSSYSITVPASRVSVITLDGTNRVTDIQDPVGGHPLSGVAFDGTGWRLTQWTDRRGGIWNGDYDCSGHLWLTRAPWITADGASRRPQSEMQHVDMQTTACAQATPANAVLATNANAYVKDARNKPTTYYVDAFLAPTRIYDALGRLSTITRDAHSRVTRIASPSGHIVLSTWSGSNVTQVTDSTAEKSVSFSYDSRYNVMTNMSGDVATVANTLDAAGKLVVSSSVAGAVPTTYSYDARGRDTLVTDPQGHSTRKRFAADQWNNTDWIWVPGGRVTTFAFDAAGRTRKVTNTNGDTSVTVLDALGRQKLQIGPRGDVTSFTYDSLYLWKVTDAVGQVYQYNRNALGWVESRIDPSLASQSFSYDLNGNIVGQSNRRGQAVTTNYDDLNRPTQVTFDPLRAPIAYSYDVNDRWMTASNDESTDTLSYDAMGRLMYNHTWRGTLGFTVTSSYFGTQGERNNVSWSKLGQAGAHGVVYSYNGGQLAGLIPFGYINGTVSPNLTFGYDADRLATTTTFPSSTGLVASITNSTTHERTSVSYGPSTALNQQAINQAFQLATRIDVLERVDERYRGISTTDTTQLYEYDGAGHLTRALDRVLGNRTCYFDAEKNRVCDYLSETWVQDQRFSYDFVGNRTDNGASVVTGNRLLAFNGFALVYDPDGNLVRKSKSGVADDSLVWNSLGQLDKVRHGGVWTTFGYDGLGRRVRKTVGAQTTRYLWDDQALFVELDASGNERVEYAYYPGSTTLAAVTVPGATFYDQATAYYPVIEGNGSVLGLFAYADNTIASQYRYEPFGTPSLIQGTTPNTLTWHGLQSDVETGLYYARSRYYDPDLARFISEDPIGLAGGINQYAYAGNDPVNASDPNGLMCSIYHETVTQGGNLLSEFWQFDFSSCASHPMAGYPQRPGTLPSWDLPSGHREPPEREAPSLKKLAIAAGAKAWACKEQIASVVIDAAGSHALMEGASALRMGWKTIRAAEGRLARRPSSLVRLASLENVRGAFVMKATTMIAQMGPQRPDGTFGLDGTFAKSATTANIAGKVIGLFIPPVALYYDGMELFECLKNN